MNAQFASTDTPIAPDAPSASVRSSHAGVSWRLVVSLAWTLLAIATLYGNSYPDGEPSQARQFVATLAIFGLIGGCAFGALALGECRRFSRSITERKLAMVATMFFPVLMAAFIMFTIAFYDNIPAKLILWIAVPAAIWFLYRFLKKWSTTQEPFSDHYQMRLAVSDSVIIGWALSTALYAIKIPVQAVRDLYIDPILALLVLWVAGMAAGWFGGKHLVKSHPVAGRIAMILAIILFFAGCQTLDA